MSAELPQPLQAQATYLLAPAFRQSGIYCLIHDPLKTLVSFVIGLQPQVLTHLHLEFTALLFWRPDCGYWGHWAN